MKIKNSSKKPVTVTTAKSKIATASPESPPADGSSVIFVQQPPKDANIPSAPSGFVATPGTDNRGLQPKKAHLAAMPDALDELDRFTDYDKVFGMTAPPLENTKQTLGAAGGWSSQRAQMRSWDLYCRTQEGLAWREARGLIDRMSQRYPGLARLFGASKQIAQRAASTRKANKDLKAQGKEPTKGNAAKKKQKQAEKALLAAANAQAGQGAAASQSPMQVQAAPWPAATPVTVMPAVPALPAVQQAPVAPIAPVAAVAPVAPVAPGAPALGASAPLASAPVAGAQGAPAAAGGGGANGVGH
jgi:hypothetical protein